MVSVVSAVAFLVYIGIVLVGVTNVVTLVFVECAIMSAHHYRDLIVRDKQWRGKFAVSYMQEVFKHIDMDGSALLHAHSGFEVASLVNIGIVLPGVANVITSVSVGLRP